MGPYVDSNNYEMMSNAFTERLSSENRASDRFFAELQNRVLGIKYFVQEELERRSIISSMIDDEEWDDPEELSDFDASPDAITEANYSAWDRFMEEKSTFESDSDYLSKFITELDSAAYYIGGLD